MTARPRMFLVAASVLVLLGVAAAGYWFIAQQRLLNQGAMALQDGHYDRAIAIARRVSFPTLRGRAARLSADAELSKNKDQRLWDDYRDDARSALLPANNTQNVDYSTSATPGEDEYRKVNDDLLALLQRTTVARLSTNYLRTRLGSYVRGNLVVTVDDLRPVASQVRIVRLIVARSDAYRHDPCAKTVQSVPCPQFTAVWSRMLIQEHGPIVRAFALPDSVDAGQITDAETLRWKDGIAISMTGNNTEGSGYFPWWHVWRRGPGNESTLDGDAVPVKPSDVGGFSKFTALEVEGTSSAPSPINECNACAHASRAYRARWDAARGRYRIVDVGFESSPYTVLVRYLTSGMTDDALFVTGAGPGLNDLRNMTRGLSHCEGPREDVTGSAATIKLDCNGNPVVVHATRAHGKWMLTSADGTS